MNKRRRYKAKARRAFARRQRDAASFQDVVNARLLRAMRSWTEDELLDVKKLAAERARRFGIGPSEMSARS